MRWGREPRSSVGAGFRGPIPLPLERGAVCGPAWVPVAPSVTYLEYRAPRAGCSAVAVRCRTGDGHFLAPRCQKHRDPSRLLRWSGNFDMAFPVSFRRGGIGTGDQLRVL